MGPRRIALLIETSRAYGRGLLRGVAAYARLKRDWSITYQERRVEEALPQWIRTWDGDGIIARLETRQHADLIAGLGRPVVDLLGLFDLPGVPSFDTDPAATARLAHQHFSDCGFAHLAFCGFEGLNFSDDRCAAFTDSAAPQSREVHVFHQSGQATEGSAHLSRSKNRRTSNVGSLAPGCARCPSRWASSPATTPAVGRSCSPAARKASKCPTRWR